MHPPAQTPIAPARTGLVPRLLPRKQRQGVVERVKKTIPGPVRSAPHRPAMERDEFGVLVLDSRSRIIGADASAAALFELPPRSLLGRDAGSILPELAKFSPRAVGEAVSFHSSPAGVDIQATSMGDAGWILKLRPHDRSTPSPEAKEKAAGKVAHKIRNSLATVLLSFNLIRSDLRRLPRNELLGEIEENLSRCESEAETLDDLVEGLKTLCFASEEERLESLSLDTLLRQTAAFFESELMPGSLLVRSGAGDVMARPHSIRMAIALLIQRAAELIGPGGRIELGAHREGRSVVVEIRIDTELPADALHGLELVQDVALRHGGSLDCRGSAFRLTVPSEGLASA